MNRTPSGEKYYINKELAYTEDHVLVRNLYFIVDIKEELEEQHLRMSGVEKGRQTGNIAGKLEQQHLQMYFEKYGRVERLDLYASENGRGSGYVIFTNPSVAAKVLLEMCHYVRKCRITVRPNYSWHQPDADKMPEKPENVDLNEPPAAIMKLNDHCLEHIFTLLSVRDRIHFARTCFRFRNIYEAMSPILDKSISLQIFEDEEMTSWELRDFFQLSGRNIKEIEGSVPLRLSYHVCFYLSMHCINLQSMKISDTIEDIKFNKFKFLANLNSLQNLQLQGFNLTDEHLQAFKNYKQLKKLDLSYNDMITGQYMNCLPNSIESLKLYGCSQLKPKFVIEMLRGLLMLKELHLTNNFSDPDFRGLFNENCCKSLEVISINYDNNELVEYESIARLPSLKKLILIISSLPSPKLFTWLVEYKSKQLEQFEINARSDWVKDEILLEIGKLTALHTLVLKRNTVITDRGLGALFNLQELREIDIYGNQKITDTGVLRLIFACPKLQVLRLRECDQLTDKLLYDIIFKLQSHQNHRPLPIKLDMTGTKVNQFTLLNGDVAAKNIIDVFCAKISYVGDEDDFNDYENDYDNFVDRYYEEYVYNNDDEYDNYPDSFYDGLL
ncbi:hypothetical protein ACLKA6_011131 [Drosophila palustris]